MKSSGVILKPGKEKPLLHRHHWIFSGAIKSMPSFQDGDLLPVYASDGRILGTGYFNSKSSIAGRMISFDDSNPFEALQNRLDEALLFREKLFDNPLTNGYRLINGEGDGIPGLVVDRYDQTLVMQFSTAGMDKLQNWIVNYFEQKLKPKLIYEKSLMPARREEGLTNRQGLLKGVEVPDLIEIRENGLRFQLSLEKSQKTGFFLDHREMRQWVRSFSEGKKVLNAFSYTGGFTVYALAGGALKVDSVDISDEAISLAQKNVALNDFNSQQENFICTDVFQFLRENELPYDLVILDPPAFAKRKKDIIPACRGYKDINRLAMQKMPPRSWLLTSSCSHYVDEGLFQKVIFQAASEAKREVRLVGTHRLAPDHPINLFHPEGNYLKSFLLYVE